MPLYSLLVVHWGTVNGWKIGRRPPTEPHPCTDRLRGTATSSARTKEEALRAGRAPAEAKEGLGCGGRRGR